MQGKDPMMAVAVPAGPPKLVSRSTQTAHIKANAPTLSARQAQANQSHSRRNRQTATASNVKSEGNQHRIRPKPVVVNQAAMICQNAHPNVPGPPSPDKVWDIGIIGDGNPHLKIDVDNCMHVHVHASHH